ncbi:MAG: wax ester/triacylglycerol synthase family O-acyltransferase [Gammaproteobacteria bacterium]|nr:wax ester/triacylglycerol synthase family O-acyltransferase [Gammaproteobacteria bacterium]
MNRLSFLDLAFFITESTQSPKHVAGLSQFKKPARSGTGWVRKLFEEIIQCDDVKPPFNQVINFKSLGGPSWKKYANFNIKDHVFYHQPEKSLNQAALYELVSGLHVPLLDRSKPLWEYHIIDNLQDNSFAIYGKIHHAYADGVTISRWMMQTMGTSPQDKSLNVFWERDGTGRKSQKDKAAAQDMFKRMLDMNKQWLKAVGGISKLVTQLALESAGLTTNAVAIPFKAREDTPLVGAVSATRQFASANLSMDRISVLRKTTRCTLNHIALTCIDAALHRYLADFDIYLDRPLSIQMPVNLRDKNEKSSGNKIGLVAVDLAPQTDDPYTRLREIGFTLRAVRNQIDGVPGVAVAQFTAVLAVVLELLDMLKLSRYLPAVSDTLISNVPGPPETLYMKGARLKNTLPMSTLAPGTQLNITLYSYAGNLSVGLIATRKVEGLQKLARYIEEAFDDLEASV